MPVHDLGYRAWEGRLQPRILRWWAIAETGIRLAWRGRWLRRLLFLAWLPAFYMGAAFLLYENLLTQDDQQNLALAAAHAPPQVPKSLKRREAHAFAWQANCGLGRRDGLGDRI